MAKPYSGDLRRRVVAAVSNGGEPAAVGRRFVVGRSTVYRWVEVARAEGRLEAKPMHGGPRPRIRGESEAALRRLVEVENHLTLAEYRDRLAEAAQVRVHPWTLGRALRRLGLTRKKEDRARGRARSSRDRKSAAGLADRGGGHPP
jgi:transposase